MSEIKNLWPAELLNTSHLLLPITILQEQARFLNEMTKNIVIAEIDTRKATLSITPSKTKPAIIHTLKVIAPAIGNYDFELVRLIQEEVFPYPLRVYAPLTDDSHEINTSTELANVLEKIFNDKKTIATVQSLLVQSYSNSDKN